MYSRSSFKAEAFQFPYFPGTLTALSPEEFATLGNGSLVFVREISGGELARFVPQAADAPEDAEFRMVMSADGTPILVTDNDEAIEDWLEDKDLTLMHRQ